MHLLLLLLLLHHKLSHLTLLLLIHHLLPRFSSSTTLFYTAEIVSALDYLHSLSIAYRCRANSPILMVTVNLAVFDQYNQFVVTCVVQGPEAGEPAAGRAGPRGHHGLRLRQGLTLLIFLSVLRISRCYFCNSSYWS